MPGVSVVVLAFATVGIGASIALYLLVRSEHGERETMDRSRAERVARRDTGDEE